MSRGGFFTLTVAEVITIFQPVVDEVIKLVDGQINQLLSRGKVVKGIVRVGGFGQSSYLYNRLKSHASGMSRSPVVLQPISAWTAVVRGAVLRGLEGTELVLSRRARRNYGIATSKRFNSLLHPPDCKYWDPYDEQWMAAERMTWYIRKDQVCSTKDPIRMPFYINTSLANSKMHKSELIVCDDDDPPTAHATEIGSSTRVLCTLTANLHQVPTHLWQRKSNSEGEQYQHLAFDLGMQLESGGLRFDCLVDDVEYGKAVASFD